MSEASTVCHKCGTSYSKPQAKFCNRCGERRKRIDAEPSTTPHAPQPVPPPQPKPAAVTAAVRSPPVPVVPAVRTKTVIVESATIEAPDPTAQTTKSGLSGGDGDTLSEEWDDPKAINLTMQTLSPDGITPEMLQTANHPQLATWRKGTLLGKGTYGSVYLGLLQDGSFAAVKVVELGDKNGAIQPRELVSLSREINNMRRVEHRNICNIHGVFYNAMEASVCIFMTYVGGGSLSSIVRKFKPLPMTVIRSWTAQLLRGLMYLHAHRIIHRDVKGDNILIDTSSAPSKEAQVKLADFGAARRLTDAVSKSRTVIGTPYWMAPEVVDISGNDQGYSYKADVWSVGCVICEMTTGKPPWPVKANVPSAIMMIAQSTGLPPELPTAEETSAGCRDFIEKCFVRNPDERPTVEDLLQHPWIKGDT